MIRFCKVDRFPASGFDPHQGSAGAQRGEFCDLIIELIDGRIRA
jgi:hypothetical protein